MPLNLDTERCPTCGKGLHERAPRTLECEGCGRLWGVEVVTTDLLPDGDPKVRVHPAVSVVGPFSPDGRVAPHPPLHVLDKISR